MRSSNPVTEARKLRRELHRRMIDDLLARLEKYAGPPPEHPILRQTFLKQKEATLKLYRGYRGIPEPGVLGSRNLPFTLPEGEK